MKNYFLSILLILIVQTLNAQSYSFVTPNNFSDSIIKLSAPHKAYTFNTDSISSLPFLLAEGTRKYHFNDNRRLEYVIANNYTEQHFYSTNNQTIPDSSWMRKQGRNYRIFYTDFGKINDTMTSILLDIRILPEDSTVEKHSIIYDLSGKIISITEVKFANNEPISSENFRVYYSKYLMVASLFTEGFIKYNYDLNSKLVNIQYKKRQFPLDIDYRIPIEITLE